MRLIDADAKTFPTPYKINKTPYAEGWNACLNSIAQQPAIDAEPKGVRGEDGRGERMTNADLLLKWVHRLGLTDWRIKLVTNCAPDEMTLPNVAGCTDWSEAIKTARIEILDPKFYGDRIVPFNFEKTLVHELLHLKLSFWCQNTDEVEDRVMHQIIDDLARAFTEKEVGADEKETRTPE